MSDSEPQAVHPWSSSQDIDGLGTPPAGLTASSWIKRLRPDLLAAFIAAGLATAIGVVIVLQVWQANLRVPLYASPGGDETFGLAVIKSILEHGRYLTNSNVGAPLGQRLYDYPVFSGDSLYLLIIKIIGIPFSNPAAVENLFFLLCFPLIALSATLGCVSRSRSAHPLSALSSLPCFLTTFTTARATSSKAPISQSHSAVVSSSPYSLAKPSSVVEQRAMASGGI